MIAMRARGFTLIELMIALVIVSLLLVLAGPQYAKWMADRAFLIVPSQAVVGQWLASFKEFPIRQKPASFNLDAVMDKLMTAPPSK